MQLSWLIHSLWAASTLFPRSALFFNLLSAATSLHLINNYYHVLHHISPATACDKLVVAAKYLSQPHGCAQEEPATQFSNDVNMINEKAIKTSSNEPTLPTTADRDPVQHKHDDGNGNSTFTPHIKAAGESGRRGLSPLHFFKIIATSSNKVSAAVNILWPFVPAALAFRYGSENHLVIFVLAYIAMVPCANLIGFAGQEFGRKMPPVLGVLVETTCVAL